MLSRWQMIHNLRSLEEITVFSKDFVLQTAAEMRSLLRGRTTVATDMTSSNRVESL